MRTGRPKKTLEISDDDREKLSTMARRPKSSQAMAMRARIVLDCARGLNNSEVARNLHITGATVCKWRERFRQQRLEALLENFSRHFSGSGVLIYGLTNPTRNSSANRFVACGSYTPSYRE